MSVKENGVEWLNGAEKPSYADKMMSSQSFFKSYYLPNDDTKFHFDLYKLAEKLGDLSAFDEISIENTPMFTIAEMGTPPLVLAFIQFLIRLHRPNRVLEIGTFVGHSAISLALAMPDGGELITLEKFDHFAEIARRNISANNLESRVRVIEGDAKVSLVNLSSGPNFDFVYLDGGKEAYLEYVKLLEPKLNVGGLFVVDDILFQGDVLNDIPQTEKGKGVSMMVDYLCNNLDYMRTFLPISNGFLIAQKIS